MEKTILLRPRLSEKTFSLASGNTVYVFDVPASANKHSVAAAVAVQFEVSVTNVNIANLKGKAKRTIRKGGRAVAGQQSGRKKAYVTLKEGQSLPFFEAKDSKEDKKAGNKPARLVGQTSGTEKTETKTAHRGLLRMRKSGER
jgi:large subunit ribosomal protein L23